MGSVDKWDNQWDVWRLTCGLETSRDFFSGISAAEKSINRKQRLEMKSYF